MEIQVSPSNESQGTGGRRQEYRHDKGAFPGKPRILIVDDESLVAWHLQSLVEDMGYADCEVASDCRTAVRRAVDHEANLLLMDVNLGEGPDGVETVRRILELRDVQVIFITAYTDEENLRRMRDVKPDASVLVKPVSFELLQAAIKRLFLAD